MIAQHGRTLPDRFSRHLSAAGLLDGSGVLAVACSGGGRLDGASSSSSTAGPRRGAFRSWRCTSAHGLRARRAPATRAFCGAAARLACRTASCPSTSRRREKGESVESAARRLRYHALLSVAGRWRPPSSRATRATTRPRPFSSTSNAGSGRGRGGISRQPHRRPSCGPASLFALRAALLPRRPGAFSWRGGMKRTRTRAFARNRSAAPCCRASSGACPARPSASRGPGRRTRNVSTRSTGGSTKRWPKRRFS